LKQRASGILTKTRKVDRFMPAEGQRSGEAEMIVQPEGWSVMANREQKSNREKRKPKKEKPKPGPVISSFGMPSNKPRGKAG
jgi:hypothetical protein